MNIVSLTNRRQTAARAESQSSGAFVAIRRGSTDWMAASQLAGELFDESGLRLSNWLQTGHASIVKDGAHRTVYRLDLVSGCYYLKHYRAPRLRNWLLNAVRSCRALLERNASRWVATQGIATYETIAIGQRRIGPFVADSYLMTRAIENTVPLDELVRDGHDRSSCPLPTALRQSLAMKLGQLIARLHVGGLLHRDMHAGNVLVRILSDNDIRLWLIDPAPMSRRSSIGLRAIEANLALLNNSLAGMTTPADRCRFFRAYWQSIRSLGSGRCSARLVAKEFPPHEVVERVERSCGKALQACHRKNDRKWVTGNRRLIIADTAVRQCRAVAGIGKAQVEQFRDNPDLLYSDAVVQSWQARSPARKTAIVEVCVDGKPTACCAMMIQTTPSAVAAREDSSARRVWEGGHALLRRSIECPRPLLFVEVSAGHNAGRQYLLAEVLPNSLRLSEFLKHQSLNRDGCPTERSWQGCLLRLAGRIRSMHESGIDHQSLSAESVLIDASSEEYRIGFWQLDSIRLRRAVSRRQAVASLASLCSSIGRFRRSSHTERLRFRCSWCSPR